MSNDHYRARIQPDPTAANTEIQGNENGLLDKVDGDKIQSVFRKSLIWVLLLIIGSVSASYLVVRYTKPLYQSYSDIKLNFKSEASIFGFSNFSDNPNYNYLSGEIELLRSRLFFSQVIKSLPLEVSYYTMGNFLVDERYRDSPFEVEFKVRDQYVMDRKFMVTIIDDKRYQIVFPWQGENGKPEEHRFGETISKNQLDLRITAANMRREFYGQPMYFILNSENALLNYISSNLDVRPFNLNANTIRITFTDHHRLKARDMVNAINTIYQSYTQDQKQRANQQKIEFLNDQLEQTETRLDEYERYFENFTISNKTADLNADLRGTIQQIVQLDTMLMQSRSMQKALNRLFTIALDSAGTVPSQMPDFPQFNEALGSLHELQLEEERLLLSYDPRTLTVRRLRQDLQVAREALLDQVEAQKEALDDEIRGLVRRRSELEKTFVQLPAKGTEYNQAERFYKLYEEFYLSLMQKRAEFEIAQAGTTTEFVVLTSATMPAAPISPNAIFIYGIGFIGGLVLSLLLVSIRYLLHNKITGLSELEKLINVPVLGSIPVYKGEKLAHTRMIISKNPKSSLSEAFRSIRTNMEFISADNGIKTIAATSTISGEGKTFVCANLGGIIALSGQKVVIVDLDMRRPRIHLAFEEENPLMGTSTILIRKHTVEECIRPTSLENLSYLPVGPVPPNPSELLLGKTFDEMLKELKEQFDVIIFDTPPIGLVTDAVLVMKKVDLPIYVFRADYSKRAFAKTLDRIRKVNKFYHLSIVLNSIKTNRSQGYGYGYGYTYGYYEDQNGGSKSWLKRILRK